MPSTVIAAFHYDAVRSVLQIVFTSGAVYEYSQVPPEKYNKMKASTSKGIYFNRHIKEQYPFKKISG